MEMFISVDEVVVVYVNKTTSKGAKHMNVAGKRHYFVLVMNKQRICMVYGAFLYQFSYLLYAFRDSLAT